MGLLVDGVWRDQWYDTASTGGRFVRSESQFRRAISDAPGAQFPAEAGRYRLYVSYACPWAHRVLIVRALLGLEGALPVTAVHPLMLADGWTFEAPHSEPLYGYGFAHQLYTRADPNYSGRVTVPILWDAVAHTIVNNESSELIRMLHRLPGAAPLDLYPEDLRAEIDAVNARVYRDVNNGVYRSGFATTQAAYEEAVVALFAALDWLEARLSRQPWLAGDRFTEADVRLFPTLLRFDAVYHYHFKCNLRRLRDYPNLWSYTRSIYQRPGVAETVDMAQVKRHYFCSHAGLNPSRVIPVGPALDLDAPHDRGRFG